MPPVKTKRYPLPNTNAATVLDYLKKNPGVSTNHLMVKLKLNPTIARKCLDGLVKHGMVRDRPDQIGHHKWSAT